MTLKETLNKPSCLLTWGREKPFISIKVMFNDFYVSLYLLNLLDSKKSEMDEKKVDILLIWQWQLLPVNVHALTLNFSQ